eukprot:SAG31_NODE_30_length_32545_cov_9.378999_22_plen_146_part_00
MIDPVLFAEAGWFGVEYETPPNLALIIKDATKLTESIEVSTPGLPCRLTPASEAWPSCALATPPRCERVCDAPFNHTGFPIFLRAQARVVTNWTFAQPGFLEAAPPPDSPVACGAAGACGASFPLTMVPHGSTDVRVGALPWTSS